MLNWPLVKRYWRFWINEARFWKFDRIIPRIKGRNGEKRIRIGRIKEYLLLILKGTWIDGCLGLTIWK